MNESYVLRLIKLVQKQIIQVNDIKDQQYRNEVQSRLTNS